MSEYNIDEAGGATASKKAVTITREHPDYSKMPDGTEPKKVYYPDESEVSSSIGIAVTAVLVILGFFSLINGSLLGMLIATGAAFGMLGATMAQRCGRDFWSWYALCFFFGLIPLLYLFFWGKTAEKKDEKLLAAGTHKTCPDCAELIKVKAVKCKHCGSGL